MSKNTNKVAIIILNWNGYKDTFECLKSLEKVTYKRLNIIVIDNGSDNNDCLTLQNEFPQIELIVSNENLGFTGGTNLGIESAMRNKPDYILLLNNDTTVEPDFINHLLEVFNQHENVGIAAPLINYYYEPKKIWTEGGKISRIRGSGFANSDRLIERIRFDYKSVSFVSGCCMLIKTQILDEIGLFDENYFLYIEDVDFCKRVIDARYSIFVSSQSQIYHKVSSSTNKNLTQLPLYYATRNRLYFAKKNFPETYLLTFLYISISMWVKKIYWKFEGKQNYIFFVKKAFSDFWKGKMGKREFI